MEVKKRVVEDIVDINGRKFVLKKYDPMLGNYILITCSSCNLPFGISDVLSKAFGTSKAGKKQLDKESFMDLQKDVLSSCYERLPAGDAPIVTSTGYGVSDLTTGIITSLFISSIIFNFTDFFVESSLGSGVQAKE